MRTRDALLVSVLLAAACDLRCSGESQVAVRVEEGKPPVVEVDGKVDATRTPGGEAKAGGEAGPKRTVEVEVEPTVCDRVDLELERIVLLPADPPFHDTPRERVSIRIANGNDQAVELGSGTDATFLDGRRALIAADLHQSDWFMPLTLPGKSEVVVQLVVPEGAGKALRTVELEATPASDPFTKCKASEDLLDGVPAPAPAPAGAKAEPAASVVIDG